ncbi:MAG: GAF domain-containing protein, partial [Flammeovirgaceae bacterium]
VGVDRAYIFYYDLENQIYSNRYEWCNEGIEPQIDILQDLPMADFSEWTEKHLKGETIEIPFVKDLPPSLTKEMLEKQDIQSILALPIMDGKVCKGFIGFDAVRTTFQFTENDKKILQVFAMMLLNINKRAESMRLIASTNEEIISINKDLEKRIQKEMDKTSQMTQSMATLDKMAMIGELTSGLAHDLNTPLGAIKV